MKKAVWIVLCSIAVIVPVVLFFHSSLGLAGVQASEPEPAQVKKRFELRTVTMADGWVISFRFNPATGESWRMNWRSADQTYIWENMVDAVKPPPGEYEIQLVDSTDSRNPKEAATFVAYRIDKASGRTWWQKQGKWLEITEPK